jgi:D-threo-aldose 1-dehydrogenase
MKKPFRLGLGTGALGGLYGFTPSPERVAELVEHAWAAGIRHFDTAPSYGFGLAEERLGHGLGDKPRDAYTVSTKVGWRLGRDDEGRPDLIADFGHEGILRSLQTSIARVGIERVDLVLVHDPDNHFDEAVKFALPTLLKLRDEGSISEVGVGMNHAHLLARFVRAVNLDCVLIAGRYSLLDQRALEELLPLCESTSTDVIVGGVYNSGILADPVRRPMFNYVPAPPEILARAQALAGVCGRFDVPLKAAAIQFPFGHPAVRMVLAGAATAAELDDTVRMLNWPVPTELWEELRRTRLLPASAPVPTATY